MNTVDPNTFVAINDLLCRFFLAFDKRDWSSMEACLAAEVMVDYASSGREQASRFSGRDFVARRRNAVDQLSKHHSFSNLLIEPGTDDGFVRVRCNYLILRFDRSGQLAVAEEDFYHSCGSYVFQMARHASAWLITSITQNALQSWGNARLHGGTRRTGHDTTS